MGITKQQRLPARHSHCSVSLGKAKSHPMRWQPEKREMKVRDIPKNTVELEFLADWPKFILFLSRGHRYLGALDFSTIGRWTSKGFCQQKPYVKPAQETMLKVKSSRVVTGSFWMARASNCVKNQIIWMSARDFVIQLALLRSSMS